MRQKELESIFSSFLDKHKIENCVCVCVRDRDRQRDTETRMKEGKNLHLSSAYYRPGDVCSNKSSYISSVNPHASQALATLLLPSD